MKKVNIVLIVAIIAVVIALLNVVVVFQRVESIRRIVGYVVDDTGEAKLTITDNVAINFTVDGIDWGEGTFDEGVVSAELDSEGTVANGTWSAVSQGLELRNIGNVKAVIELAAGKDAAAFIGGTDAGGPEYQWKISEVDIDACSGDLSDITYTNVNTTGLGTTICTEMDHVSGKEHLGIDIRVFIPQDSPTDAKTDTLTATATAI